MWNEQCECLQIVFSIIYVMIVYFMTSQPLELMRFSMLLSMCILTSLVAQSLGLLIGAAMSVEVSSKLETMERITQK
jgi:ABC-2 type transporter.